MTRVAQDIAAVAPPHPDAGAPALRATPVRIHAPLPGPTTGSREPASRFCDRRPDWRSRAVGMAGTLAIALAVLAIAFTAWTIVCPAPPVERTLTVELLPVASPRQPVRDVAPGPRQVERKAVHAEHRPRPDPPPIVAIATPLAPPLPAPSQETPPSDPAPPVPQTTAPRAIAAPAATRLSDPAPSNWEGALLAHLERFRRYPAHARAAGQQGTVYVTFRMNRAGAVLEARVVRGSQSASLDQAALDTIRRAQPLPAIPPDRPDTMELTIPVEFYLQTG